MLPWVQNDERHRALGWAFSIMTSSWRHMRHMRSYDVINWHMTSLWKMPSLALDGAHCFTLRGASMIRIHQESDYITDFQVYLRVPMDYPNAKLTRKASWITFGPGLQPARVRNIYVIIYATTRERHRSPCTILFDYTYEVSGYRT